MYSTLVTSKSDYNYIKNKKKKPVLEECSYYFYK